MKRLFIPLTLVIFLTSCAPAAPVPTAAPLPSTVTVTAAATSTATPTAEPTSTFTPEPTATPTIEPTEEVNLEKICESWKDVKGCAVTVEDVTSGRMLDIDRAVVKQLGMETFPPEAYAVGDKFTMNDTGMEKYLWYQAFDENEKKNSFYDDYIKNPSHRPYRWIPSFYQIEIPAIKDRTNLITTQQWLNPSGKISHLHYVVNGHDGPGDVEPLNWVFRDMHFEFPSFGYNNSSGNEKIHKVFNETFSDKETTSLLNEWMTTGEIPDQLQYKLLSGIVFDPRME